MRTTKHLSKRMNQRGISKNLANLALEVGHDHGDRCVLGRREVDAELQRLDDRRRLLIKARDKGGVVVVTDDEALVTTSRFEGRLSH